MDGIGSVQDLLFRSLMVVCIVLILFWAKQRQWKSKMSASMDKQFPGWVQDAQVIRQSDVPSLALDERKVMKPIKTLRASVLGAVFCGGGAILLWHPIQKSSVIEIQHWLGFLAAVGLFIFFLWGIVFSFTKITFDRDTLEHFNPLTGRRVLRFSELEAIKPTAQTILNGVFLEFAGGKRIRVVAKMSGYRQLLEMFAEHDTTIAEQLALYSSSFEEERNA